MTPTNSRWVRPLASFRTKYLLMEVRAGKLAKSTILSGFSSLKELSEVISQPDSARTRGFSDFRAACEVLTSRYYSWVFAAPFRENI